jgi:predicted PurR-regulated permease PerM
MILPKKSVNFLHGYMIRATKICYSYIYSQLIDAVIVSTLCFIIFSIIGIPYAILFAIFMGFCNLIPYFGALIGGAVVVLITLVSTGDILTTIIALVCLLVVQQVDANVIQPRIVADTVGLKPLYVLLAIMIGGGIFGFIGIYLFPRGKNKLRDGIYRKRKDYS